MQTSDTLNTRHLKRDLSELAYSFRSLQLFLEHLEIRFQHLLKLLDPLVPAWQAQERHSKALENELESTCQEVSFLQRELKTLEGILASQAHSRQSQWQSQLSQLESAYLELSRQCEQSYQQIEALKDLSENLLEQAQAQEAEQLEQNLLKQEQEQVQTLERQQEQTRLAEALQSFDDSEQEYLRLLAAKDLQIQEMQRLYEFELEQMAQELSDSSQDQHSRQQQSQTLGRSLARLAQERNTGLQTQQQLQSENQELKAQNQALQAELEQLRAQQTEWVELEDLWQEHFSTHLPLEVLSYVHFWQSAQGLGLDLPEQLYRELAEAFQLPEKERLLLEQRLHLQPGRLQHLLAAWARPQNQQPAPVPHNQLLSIPAAAYPLGDDLHPAERPAHTLQLEAFQLARLPVTNADFARFLEAGAYQNPDYWLPEGWNFIQAEGIKAPAFWQKRGYACSLDYPDYPVMGVSWYEAMAYAAWAGLRLPSEAEWEAAGRGPEGLRWPWGDQWREGLANTAEAAINNTSPVGLFPAGASPFGCLDLIGNVFEWTSSIYLPYPYKADEAHEDLRSTAARSLRGCSWNHRGHYFTRLSYRFQAEPSIRHSDIGFRLAGTPTTLHSE